MSKNVFEELNEELNIDEEIESYFLSDEQYESIKEEYGVDIKELEREFNDYSPKRDLYYGKLSDDATSPKYAYDSDSGFDLHSTIEYTLKPFSRALIPTGLKFDIPEGFEIQVRPKSGLALNFGLTVLNTPGTVDSGYLGEVKVIVFNTSNEDFTIKKGMKIAQAVLCPVINGKWVNLVEKSELQNKDRNTAGFGSTGI
jgi:dUTP pyrophosphatase